MSFGSVRCTSRFVTLLSLATWNLLLATSLCLDGVGKLIEDLEGYWDYCSANNFDVIQPKGVINRQFWTKDVWNNKMFASIDTNTVPSLDLQILNAPCWSGFPNKCCKAVVRIRLGTSDWYVYQRFFPRPHFWKALFQKQDAEYILDAGANGGFSTMWFALMFPGAQIVGVEADVGNFQNAAFNTQPYRNVMLKYAGLWGNQNAKLSSIGVGDDGDPDFSKWGFIVDEAGPTEVGQRAIPAVTVDGLMAAHKWPRVDIAKINIEGSEGVVFGSDSAASWLQKAQVVTVEVHDRLAQNITCITKGTSIGQTIRDRFKSLPFVYQGNISDTHIWWHATLVS